MVDRDKLYRASLWKLQLHNTSNDTFFPLYFDHHRYLVLKGGGGSGKSVFAGRKVLERVIREPGHRWLVCRKVAKTLRESCYKQLLGQIGEHYPTAGAQYNKSDMVISFPNGSEIIFAGLDDVEKLKSIYNITGIWIEEASELLETDFNQLDIRLRGETKYYKQIILSFNPVSIQHWLKRRFWDTQDERALTHESTYKDNKWLDDEAKRTLEAFKDSDEYYYQVYCLGQWGVTGRTIFNAQDVMRRLQDNIQPVKVGYFDYDDDGLHLWSPRFVEDPQGPVRIYKEPEPGIPYVIGGDTAGEGSDSFVGQVLDNRTGQQVCTLKQTYDEDVYARQMFCLGLYYNEALIGIETNYSTYPVMELERLKYPRQYVRETVDDFTHRIKHSYGFRTDRQTRPVIISELVKTARENIDLIVDKSTLEEMLTFVRNENFRPEAEEGAHDDCIMALAIAHYIRPQQAYTVKAKAPSMDGWTESMVEDYERASPAEREYLRKKWGTA